jgi:hypothetical protein
MDNVLIIFPHFLMIIADYYHTFAKTNTGNNTGFLLNEQHTSKAQKQVKVLLIVKYTIR